MSAHEEFLEGFGDAIGVSDPQSIAFHYARWAEISGFSEIELIDLEIDYETGLRAGEIYKDNCL